MAYLNEDGVKTLWQQCMDTSSKKLIPTIPTTDEQNKSIVGYTSSSSSTSPTTQKNKGQLVLVVNSAGDGYEWKPLLEVINSICEAANSNLHYPGSNYAYLVKQGGKYGWY